MIRSIILFLLSLFFYTNLIAQEDSIKVDSIPKKITSGNQVFDSLFISSDTLINSNKDTRTIGSLLSKLINKAQQHAIELGNIKLKLSEDLDTTKMANDIPTIRTFISRIKENAIQDQENLNLRYLKGMDNLIVAVAEENDKFAKIINDRVTELTNVGNTITAIKNDSLFNLSLRDTTLVPVLNSELKTLKNTLRNVDSVFFNQEITLAKFQARISENAILLMDLRQFLSINRNKLESKYWEKEIHFPWEPSDFKKEKTFTEVFTQSTLVNLLILYLYFQRNIVTIVGVTLLFFIFYLKFKSIVKSISNEKEFASLILDRVKYFRKHTFAATVIFSTPFYLIIFHRPPLIFVSILSFLMVVAATFLIKEQFGKKFFTYWTVFLTPYLLIAISGLQWKIAYEERWFLMASSALFIVMGIMTLKDLRMKNYLGSTFLRVASVFLIAIELFSLVMNVLGRYNLAKTYAVAGAVNFYRAVGLFLFIMVTMEAIYLLVEYSKKGRDGFTSFFDFQDLQKRMRGFLIFFSVAIWLYGLIWHLGYFDKVFDFFSEFLFKERLLGNTSFEFGSILLFIIILMISTFLANNIAYFASMQDQKTALTRKQRLGSSVLLIRLGVLIIGFFIGATAAKIPLDKITIVLGALSVGIGFGLQTIINNLVSGIILAFERPIQIGDEIVVGQNSGTVKDVGIRASKIQAYDGSEIVIPNGDLLSQSLINWTLSDKRRRIELIIGVGYSSNMKNVQTILMEILSRNRIMKNPEPKVYMQNFGESSVDFRLLFWVETMDIWIDMRAEVMAAIFDAFSEHGVEIPFPKRDLYIKSIPEPWKETVTGPNKDQNPTPSEE
ncbi:mechanosensitive ion channel [Algoriphagus aestuarii]|nr:mechanosensitive ion channel [Algoriphagus aestuarii]